MKHTQTKQRGRRGTNKALTDKGVNYSKLLLLLTFIFLFSFTFISAAPPFQTGVSGTGYQIKFPQTQTLTQNTNFTLNFHVFNISNGVPIDNSSTKCVLHFYDFQGSQTFEGNVSHSNSITVNNEWEIIMLSGNISETGEYSYLIQCNSLTNNLGGFDAVGLLVTPTGSSGDFTLVFIIGFLLFYGLTFYGIKMENEWVSLIGCFGLLIMGLYTSFYGIGNYKNDISNIFSYVTIAIGLGIGFEALRKITYY